MPHTRNVSARCAPFATARCTYDSTRGVSCEGETGRRSSSRMHRPPQCRPRHRPASNPAARPAGTGPSHHRIAAGSPVCTSRTSQQIVMVAAETTRLLAGLQQIVVGVGDLDIHRRSSARASSIRFAGSSVDRHNRYASASSARDAPCPSARTIPCNAHLRYVRSDCTKKPAARPRATRTGFVRPFTQRERRRRCQQRGSTSRSRDRG